MQVHALPSVPKPGGGPLRRHAARLIELCGTPRFEPALFQAAREAALCEHVTAFAFGGAAQPRVVLATNTGAAPVARQVADKYIHHYWRLDPAWKVPDGAQQSPPDYALRMTSDDIDHGDYRQECYTGVGLHDRISLVTRRDRETLRLNFYRGTRSGRFAPEAMDHIMEAADLILALLAKHDCVALPRGAELSGALERRLVLLAAPLPRREREVCTLIAAGLSSEGIALELGVSLNTVLTHRKRAYARLGISSQNELLRLLLS